MQILKIICSTVLIIFLIAACSKKSPSISVLPTLQLPLSQSITYQESQFVANDSTQIKFFDRSGASVDSLFYQNAHQIHLDGSRFLVWNAAKQHLAIINANTMLLEREIAIDDKVLMANRFLGVWRQQQKELMVFSGPLSGEYGLTIYAFDSENGQLFQQFTINLTHLIPKNPYGIKVSFVPDIRLNDNKLWIGSLHNGSIQVYSVLGKKLASFGLDQRWVPPAVFSDSTFYYRFELYSGIQAPIESKDFLYAAVKFPETYFEPYEHLMVPKSESLRFVRELWVFDEAFYLKYRVPFTGALSKSDYKVIGSSADTLFLQDAKIPHIIQPIVLNP